MQYPLKKNFFISYNKADQQWAEWIAWQLEEEGYTTVLQAWDMRPGSNFVLEMQNATQETERTIAVLSPDYLNAPYSASEWAAAFRQDPTGQQGILVPVRVQLCKPEGLLGPIIYIDLVDQDEEIARQKLLAGLQRGRPKPLTAPRFPGEVHRSIRRQPQFPGTRTLAYSPSPPYVPSQQQVYAPPGRQVESIAPPRRNRKGAVIAGIVVSILLMSCIGFGILGYGLISSLVGSIFPPSEPPSGTLTTFCNALKSQGYQTAYNQLSSGFQRSFTSEAQFADKYGNSDGNGRITECKLLHSDVNGPLGGFGTLEVTFANGRMAWDSYHLIGENGVWKIDRMDSRQYFG